VHDSGALLNGAEHVSRGDLGAGLDRRSESPATRGIECGRHDARLDEVPDALRDTAEGAPDAVQHRAEQPWAEVDRERPARGGDGLAYLQARGVLVDLHGGDVARDADDLTHEAARPDPHQLVERRLRERSDDGERARDAQDTSFAHLSLTRYPIT